MELRRFVEKPDQANAQKMLEQGNYLWNAGIFLFSVRSILAAFGKFTPELIGAVDPAIKQGQTDLGFFPPRSGSLEPMRGYLH